MTGLVSLSHLAQRRIPALIAIVAVLLLFIAPEVSRTLEQRRPSMETSLSAHRAHVENYSGTSAMANEMMQPGHQMQHRAAPPDGPAHHAMATMFACDYCQLLVHCPLLLTLFCFLLLLVMRAAGAPPQRLPVLVHFTFIPGLFQPRAPPGATRLPIYSR